MKENLPEISYERSMNHNYMILGKCSFFGKGEEKGSDYRTKMLLENRIPGLLPVTHRLINGESRYYYEINSLQSLDRLYDKTEIRYDGLRHLLSGCVSLFNQLEEYLLDGTQVIIKPELIYVDVEKMEPYFVCYPDYEGDVRLSFMEFVDELLTKIDHTDECAVMLGYQIYRYTRNPNYVISEIGNMMERVIANMTYREMDRAQNNLGSLRDDGCVFGNVRQYGVHKMDVPDRSANQTGTNEHIQVQNHFAMDSYEEEQDTEISKKRSGQKTKNISDLIGGIFCIFVSLCSGAIILGARLLHYFQLSGNNELYLYGAMGMAIVAAVLFFACYIKKRRQDREAGLTDEDEDSEAMEYYTAAGSERDRSSLDNSQPGNFLQNTDQSEDIARIPSNGYSHYENRAKGQVPQREYSETAYLGESVVEERVLCGHMNGREVNIPLDNLPMTVGKLASVSDFVLNDAAVSKMHARFEEHDGRVYIRDLNSTNGTVRNGELLAVNQSVALEPGDRLRFGRTSFIYC